MAQLLRTTEHIAFVNILLQILSLWTRSMAEYYYSTVEKENIIFCFTNVCYLELSVFVRIIRSGSKSKAMKGHVSYILMEWMYEICWMKVFFGYEFAALEFCSTKFHIFSYTLAYTLSRTLYIFRDFREVSITNVLFHEFVFHLYIEGMDKASLW